MTLHNPLWPPAPLPRAELPRQCPDLGAVDGGRGSRHPASGSVFAGALFDIPVIQVDSDNMTGREAMSQLVQRVLQGDPVLMIGTQMLSKGHHFPHVTLVAVVDADAQLLLFRGEERLLQLLTQAAAVQDARPHRAKCSSRHAIRSTRSYSSLKRPTIRRYPYSSVNAAKRDCRLVHWR